MSRRSKRPPSPAMVSTAIGVALMLAIAGWFLWADAMRARLHDSDDAAAYAASGPPCPTATAAGLAANGPHLRHSFEYGDMILSYASGAADCAWIKGQAGQQAVCKFDSPGALGVKRKGPQALFAPGLGNSAAIVRQGDRFSCVMIPRID
jgi:hypothetical protein